MLFSPAHDLIHQPSPCFTLARTRGLGDGDVEIRQLAIDFLGRQHIEPGRKHRQFEHRGLRTIEPAPNPVRLLVNARAHEARTLRILVDMMATAGSSGAPFRQVLRAVSFMRPDSETTAASLARRVSAARSLPRIRPLRWTTSSSGTLRSTAVSRERLKDSLMTDGTYSIARFRTTT